MTPYRVLLDGRIEAAAVARDYAANRACVALLKGHAHMAHRHAQGAPALARGGRAPDPAAARPRGGRRKRGVPGPPRAPAGGVTDGRRDTTFPTGTDLSEAARVERAHVHRREADACVARAMTYSVLAKKTREAMVEARGCWGEISDAARAYAEAADTAARSAQLHAGEVGREVGHGHLMARHAQASAAAAERAAKAAGGHARRAELAARGRKNWEPGGTARERMRRDVVGDLLARRQGS